MHKLLLKNTYELTNILIQPILEENIFSPTHFFTYQFNLQSTGKNTIMLEKIEANSFLSFTW
jgi:hypothetical protein